MTTRRAFLAQLGAAAAITALPDVARAMGRTPLGGRVSLHVPWPTGAIDPHDLRDGAAALFASAIADPAYALDATGAPYPSLATGLPVREAGETLVHLREGMRTARLVPLDARDLVATVLRAKASGAAALLADIPRPKLRRGDPYAVSFGSVEPLHLARVLASPLVAVLPRRFSPTVPDGTGAFRADVSPSGLVLTRNLHAARGPSFLDAIRVAPADGLKTSLRAFESERDDIGWLGLGLHDGRRGAIRFDLGRAAWVVLTTGPDTGGFGLPGVAQRLVDAIPPERLAHLGLGPRPPARGDPGWGGAPAELLVDESSPHLVDVARAVAPVLSRTGHEVTATLVSRAELARRRARGKAPLTIELVRPLGPSPLHTLLSLATAEDVARGRDLARSPPRLRPGAPARSMTSMLRVGVIGEIRVAGGVIPDLALAKSPSGDGWDLGATFRKPVRR